MIGFEPRSPVDLKYIFFCRHNFVFVTLTEDTFCERDQTVVTFTSVPACTETADPEEEGERRVGVARQVFAVDLGVLGCPRVLCVTIPASVSVTETSRGGSAKHGAQLQSLTVCVLQFSGLWYNILGRVGAVIISLSRALMAMVGWSDGTRNSNPGIRDSGPFYNPGIVNYMNNTRFLR